MKRSYYHLPVNYSWVESGHLQSAPNLLYSHNSAGRWYRTPTTAASTVWHWNRWVLSGQLTWSGERLHAQTSIVARRVSGSSTRNWKLSSQRGLLVLYCTELCCVSRPTVTRANTFRSESGLLLSCQQIHKIHAKKTNSRWMFHCNFHKQKGVSLPFNSHQIRD